MVMAWSFCVFDPWLYFSAFQVGFTVRNPLAFNLNPTLILGFFITGRFDKFLGDHYQCDGVNIMSIDWAPIPPIMTPDLVATDGTSYQFLVENKGVLYAVLNYLAEFGFDLSDARHLLDEMYRYLQHLWSCVDHVTFMLESSRYQAFQSPASGERG